MLTTLPAGTLKIVVCSHCLVVGFWMKYDTQSGWVLTVFCGSSCNTTLTLAPVSGVTPEVKSTVCGLARKKCTTTNTASAATARKATSSVTTRAGRDTGHHLASAPVGRPRKRACMADCLE